MSQVSGETGVVWLLDIETFLEIESYSCVIISGPWMKKAL